MRRGAALLPELLDLNGAIQVVHALQSAPVHRPSPPDPRAAAQHARGRLQAAEHAARKPLRAPITGAPLATPEHLARVFEGGGIPPSRTTKALARATGAIFTPIETVTRQRIATVRGPRLRRPNARRRHRHHARRRRARPRRQPTRARAPPPISISPAQLRLAFA